MQKPIKPKRKVFKKSVLGLILGTVAIANIFGLGFSSFLINADTHANVGDINVNVGDLADCRIEPSKPANCDLIGSSGFYINSAFSNVGNFYAYYKIKMYVSSLLSLTFSFDETGQSASKYSLSKYISDISLTLKFTAASQLAEKTINKKVTGQTLDSAKASFSFGTHADFTYNQKALDAIELVTVTYKLSYNKTASNLDFGQDIYYPMAYDGLNISLGVSGNE